MRGRLPVLRGLALALATISAALAWGASSACAAPSLPSGFQDSVVFGGLEEPTAVRFSPDGRIFIAEKEGKILVYDSLQDSEPTEFADLRTDVYDIGDRGLLGLALAPNFPREPYVYALYAYDHILGDSEPPPKWGEADHSGDECPRPEGDCEVSGRLVRLTAAGGGDEATTDGNGDPARKVLVEDWCQQFSSHSVGDLRFGPEGDLYASGGEGASFSGPDYGQHGNPCGDPFREGGALRAQDARTPSSPGDPTDLNGSLIRIDPETGEGVPGNPLFGSTDPNERRIVAYGFRNPFRFAIDPVRHEIYVGNVGWNSYEEIDRLPAEIGSVYNSGWPCYEGPEPNPVYADLELELCESLYAEPAAVASPFFYYLHADKIIPGDDCNGEEGWVISGLAFYEGGSYPSVFDGALFFADPVRGCIYVMFPGSDGRPDPLSTATFLSNGGVYPGIDVEPGPGGDLFYTKLFDVNRDGTLHRISYDPDAPVARLGATPEYGSGPIDVELDASGSTDPNGDSLAYEWDLDGNGSFETDTGGDPHATHRYEDHANVVVAVRVDDGTGHSSIARVTVYPRDTPPEPVIEAPGADLAWHVGQRIDFSGQATDQQETLGDSSLYWKARLLHCPIGPDACHAHPLQVFPGVSSGHFFAPDHEYPSFIELLLTATDSRGLSATQVVKIAAKPVHLTLESEPPGVELSAALASHTAPFEISSIEGSEVVVSAPATATLDGRKYKWSRWSDGGARVHSIFAVESGTYTAEFTDLGTESKPPPPRVAPVRPRIEVWAHPAKRTRSHQAKFSFSSSLPRMSFRCGIDGKASVPCRSPRLYKNLRLGSHVFRLKGVAADGGGAAHAVFRWVVVCPSTDTRHRHKPRQGLAAEPQSRSAYAATPPLRACARPAGSAGRRG
jgi:glucose/arabinose dehydrogenase